MNASNLNNIKRIADITAEISAKGQLHISFGASGNTITVTPAQLAPEIRAQAELHGLKQKLVDAAAIARDTATGRSATSADKEAAVMEVYNRITAAANPSWNKVREAGATAVGGLLVAALMEMTGKTKEGIVAYLASKSTEEKAALRKNQKVAEIITRLQSVKVNPNIDTDSLLGELMGEMGDSEIDEDAVEEAVESTPEEAVEEIAEEVAEETKPAPKAKRAAK